MQVYRVEMASQEGESWSFRACGREGIVSLRWAEAVPAPRDLLRPEGDLGPRYILVIERVRGGSGPAVVRQDYYPLADGGSVVFAAPGQIFSHPFFGGIYTVPTGWSPVLSIGSTPGRLRDLGAPIPFPTPPTLTPSSEPTPAASSDPEGPSGGGTDGPDLVTLLAVGVIAAAVVLVVIRKRSGS